MSTNKHASWCLENAKTPGRLRYASVTGIRGGKVRRAVRSECTCGQSRTARLLRKLMHHDEDPSE